jgi:hypothetical protein
MEESKKILLEIIGEKILVYVDDVYINSIYKKKFIYNHYLLDNEKDYICYIRTNNNKDLLMNYKNSYIYDKSLYIINSYDSIYFASDKKIEEISNYKIYINLYKLDYCDSSLLCINNLYTQPSNQIKKLIHYSNRLLFYVELDKKNIHTNTKFINTIKSIDVITDNGYRGNIICDYIFNEYYERLYIKKLYILNTEIVFSNDNDHNYVNKCCKSIDYLKPFESKVFDINIMSKYEFICIHKKNEIISQLNKLNVKIYLCENYKTYNYI